MDEWRTVGEALREASSFLQQHVRSLARLPQAHQAAISRHEAEVLLGHLLGFTRIQLLMHLGDPLPAPTRAALQAALSTRQADTPLQYITGEAPFYGRMFQVRPGCLIPRPETEILAEAALKWLATAGITAPTIADLGTGSGAIAITLALDAPGAEVHAVDVSAEAIVIARENAQLLGAGVTFHEGDAFAMMASEVPPVQLLVSNPPYIPTEDVAELDAEVQQHEPLGALDGGADGLDFYRRLAEVGSGWFRAGSAAALFLEVGSGQALDVIELFTLKSAWQRFEFHAIPDLRGIDRVVCGMRA